jgi:hypothetical protein
LKITQSDITLLHRYEDNSLHHCCNNNFPATVNAVITAGKGPTTKPAGNAQQGEHSDEPNSAGSDTIVLKDLVRLTHEKKDGEIDVLYHVAYAHSAERAGFF